MGLQEIRIIASINFVNFPLSSLLALMAESFVPVELRMAERNDPCVG